MKSLLGIKDLSAEEIRHILDEAKTLKQEVLLGEKKTAYLRGVSLVTLFFENSTRTRLSFELAGKYLGGMVANIAVAGSSVAKGETLVDTAKTIDAMATDIVILRHSSSGAPHLLDRHIGASVVNAGDGMHEHPTQALLDLMTMEEMKGSVKGLRVAIVGDVKHSRVARSNIYALHKMGADVVLGGPSTLMPAEIEAMGVKAYWDVEKAIAGADIVMGLRIQLERQKKGSFPTIGEYHKYFGINEERLKLAAPDAILMHPGPVNRGVELSAEVADCDQSVIQKQVTNGVCVRMAVLKQLAEARRNR